MNASHTPSPWQWAGNDWLCGGHRGATDILKAELNDDAPPGCGLARIDHHYSPEVAAANRALIEASPDMAAALARLLRWAESVAQSDRTTYTGDHPIAKAREALAKAGIDAANAG